MATKTFYPGVAGTVDGYAAETGSYVDFADIRNAAGDTANTTDSQLYLTLGTDPSANFSSLKRMLMTFDTSGLGGVTPTAAEIELVVSNKWTNGTGPTCVITNAALASDSAIVAGDYDSVGTTKYAEVAYASMLGTATFTLNASGIGSIDPDGISTFAAILGYDFANSFGGSLDTNGTWGFLLNTSDAILSLRPRLIVEYEAALDIKETLSFGAEMDKKPTKILKENLSLGNIVTFFKLSLREHLTVFSRTNMGNEFLQSITQALSVSDTKSLFKNGLMVLWGKVTRPVGAVWNKIIRR